jgi:uncharacterized membrane protein
MYWMTTPLLTLVHDNETKKYRKSETSKLYAGSNVHNYNIFYNYIHDGRHLKLGIVNVCMSHLVLVNHSNYQDINLLLHVKVS